MNRQHGTCFPLHTAWHRVRMLVSAYGIISKYYICGNALEKKLTEAWVVCDGRKFEQIRVVAGMILRLSFHSARGAN